MTNNSNQQQVVAQVEVHEYLESKVIRRQLFPKAILVGIFSGGLATGFRIVLDRAHYFRPWLMHFFPNNPWMQGGIAAIIATIGIWLGLIIGSKDKDSGGSGIPHMKAVLEGHSDMHWSRLILVKFCGAIVALGSGLALGREGPTIQMGGAAGIAVSKWTGATGRERRALAAAGAGAGLAAAFNAPLAGVTFVLEELQRDFQPVVFGAALLCAAVATVVSRLFSGQASVFSVPSIPTPSLIFIPLFLGIGALSGFVGVVFNRGLLWSSEKVGKVRKSGFAPVAIGVGLLSGVAFTVSPFMLGAGHGLSEAALHGQLFLLPAVLFLVVRIIYVHFCYSTGVPGGIFAPLLSMGALIGVIMFRGTTQIFPNGPSVAACAVAGMCGLFSGVVRAPLTGIILIAEMTGSYDLLLPLLASSFTAYAVAEAMGDTPIYEALLQRDAIAKGWDLDEGELVTAEFEIEGGSNYDGKLIRDLSMPPGLLVILCRYEAREFVPKADTVLKDGMRIVVATSSPVGMSEIALKVKAPN